MNHTLLFTLSSLLLLVDLWIQNMEEHELVRNEYVRLRTDEKDVIDKCKEDPKMFIPKGSVSGGSAKEIDHILASTRCRVTQSPPTGSIFESLAHLCRPNHPPPNRPSPHQCRARWCC